MTIASLNFEVIRATPAVAEFLVHVELTGLSGECEVSGRVVGPKCAGISTVEVAYPLTRMARNDRVVSLRCAIPEPNLWAPESRFTYEVSIALHVNGDLVDSRTSEIALRSR